MKPQHNPDPVQAEVIDSSDVYFWQHDIGENSRLEIGLYRKKGGGFGKIFNLSDLRKL